MTFIVKPAANADVMEAMAWQVRRRRYSAAAGIWDEWQTGQDKIEAMPQLYPQADDAPPGYEVRNYLTQRYGYLIVYQVTSTDVIVHAFVRASRRSAAWLNRPTP